jgi:hypothetical protein
MTIGIEWVSKQFSLHQVFRMAFDSTEERFKLSQIVN